MIHLNKRSFFISQLSKWYLHNRRQFIWRENGASLYIRIISEFLLQRTKARTVNEALSSIIREYPDWDSLAAVELEDLENILKPLGLWRRRAESLKKLALAMVERDYRWPIVREEINQLPGVGQYIGNAVELICHGRKLPLLDVNMARVLERFFGPRKLSDIRHDPYLQKLAYDVVQVEDPISMNFAVLDFAALVCQARKPRCDECPLRRRCRYYTTKILS